MRRCRHVPREARSETNMQLCITRLRVKRVIMAGAALTSLAFLVIWGYRELLARRAFIHGTVTHEDRPLAGVSIRLERWTELPLGFTATEGRPIDFIPELIDSYE